jgi:hypothetical protein
MTSSANKQLRSSGQQPPGALDVFLPNPFSAKLKDKESRQTATDELPAPANPYPNIAPPTQSNAGAAESISTQEKEESDPQLKGLKGGLRENDIDLSIRRIATQLADGRSKQAVGLKFFGVIANDTVFVADILRLSVYRASRVRIERVDSNGP